MEYGEFKVDSLPNLTFNHTSIFDMHAGEIPITEAGSSLFFWDFISPIENNKKRPLVIWLNGGPGCSSLDGALMEIGPLRIQGDDLRFNKGWFELADLVFIDQPLATGFSKLNGDDTLITDLKASTENLMTFLDKYFTMIGKSGIEYDDIIIGGESYAGQYIPHLARSMKDNAKLGPKIRGISMGNAWIDPNLQSLSFIPFSILNGLIDPKKDSSKLEYLLTQQDKCQNVINENQDVQFVDQTCDGILSNLLSVFKPEPLKCINVYDISKVDSFPACGNNWPETLGDVTKYLNVPEVQTALNVKSHKTWSECNNNIFKIFKPSGDQLSSNLLSGLLEDGLKIQLFSGVNDLICNYLSTEMVLKHHLRDFIDNEGEKNADFSERGIQSMDMSLKWEHDGEVSGEAEIWGNLSYIKVDDASHMVAYDLSKRSIGLLELMLDDVLTTNNGTLTTGQEREISEEEDDQKGGMIRYVSLGLLLFVFIALGAYLVKSIMNDKRYSSLSDGSKTGQKKKKVHWRDLERLSDDDEFELQDLPRDL